MFFNMHFFINFKINQFQGRLWLATYREYNLVQLKDTRMHFLSEIEIFQKQNYYTFVTKLVFNFFPDTCHIFHYFDKYRYPPTPRSGSINSDYVCQCCFPFYFITLIRGNWKGTKLIFKDHFLNNAYVPKITFFSMYQFAMFTIISMCNVWFRCKIFGVFIEHVKTFKF